MIRLMLVIALVWLALIPPFFTDGACTAEFDKVARQIQDNKPSLASSAAAQAYWNSVHVPAELITAAGRGITSRHETIQVLLAPMAWA
jgi:hypothetical protein